MFEPSQYELLDFGVGRKLERFGGEVLDRPSPAAEGIALENPGLWTSATARFSLEGGGKGQWSEHETTEGASWLVAHGDARLLMQQSASGNVGLFPEQASNWDWIAGRVSECRNNLTDRLPRVLNLFAYTGGASLAAALAGAEVTHVDSSGPTVAWAKRNAEESGAIDLPIRWLVEDAMKFVARECRRGNRYDGIIADPPTYGHGPKGKPFKFAQHVDELMELCGELLDDVDGSRRFLVFSCHTPGFDADDAAAAVTRVLGTSNDAPARGGRVTSKPLTLDTRDGRRLSAGVSARWASL